MTHPFTLTERVGKDLHLQQSLDEQSVDEEYREGWLD